MESKTSTPKRSSRPQLWIFEFSMLNSKYSQALITSAWTVKQAKQNFIDMVTKKDFTLIHFPFSREVFTGEISVWTGYYESPSETSCKVYRTYPDLISAIKGAWIKKAENGFCITALSG